LRFRTSWLLLALSEACGYFGIDPITVAPIDQSGGSASGGRATGGANPTGGRPPTSSGGRNNSSGGNFTGGASFGGRSGGDSSLGGDFGGDPSYAGAFGGQGGVPSCDSGSVRAFGAWDKIDTLGVSGDISSPSVTEDGLMLVFSVNTGTTEGIYESHRASRSDAFGPGERILQLSQGDRQLTPFVNRDGNRIYFAAQTGTDPTTLDLLWSNRANRNALFGDTRQLDELNDETTRDFFPSVTRDERTIFFVSSRDTTSSFADIFTATRRDLISSFSSPRRLPFGEGKVQNGSPTLSADGLTLFFTAVRGNSIDIYRADRATRDSDFARARPEPSLSSEGDELSVHLSPDGNEAYLVSTRDGPKELFVAERECFEQP
jgi:Tol biopolymer transport system component